jgi:hypothetical protein
MDFIGIRNLCSPAYFYLVISLIALVIIMIQSSSNPNIYCVGNYSCETSNIYMVFVLKLLYVLFWTWILNIICRNGLSTLAWVLVLFPILLMFFFISMFLFFSASGIPSTVPSLM